MIIQHLLETNIQHGILSSVGQYGEHAHTDGSSMHTVLCAGVLFVATLKECISFVIVSQHQTCNTQHNAFELSTYTVRTIQMRSSLHTVQAYPVVTMLGVQFSKVCCCGATVPQPDMNRGLHLILSALTLRRVCPEVDVR